MKQRKVLIIAHTFPPSGGVGVQRTVKFVKYLNHFGWEPIVLTVDWNLNLTDETWLNDIPSDTRVIRTFTLEPPASWKNSKRLKYLYKLIVWLSVPDLAILWLPFAVWVGVQQVRQNHIDAIYATGDPFSAFIIGVLLKKIFKLPLTIDFRDPWTLNPRRFPRKWYVFWREPIERMLEAICVKYTDKVLIVNAPTSQFIQTGRNAAVRQKFVVITNGFDAEDIELSKCGERVEWPDLTDKITLVYVGSLLIGYRFSHTFFKGLQILLQTRPELKAKLRCLFVGDNQPLDLPGLSDIVYWQSYVNYRKAIKLIFQADILLLLTGGSPHDLPAKTFEYIATGKPIFALASDGGATAELLCQVGLGKVVSPTNVEEIAVGLSELIDDVQVGIKPEPNWTAINQYDRRNITGQLAAVLNEVVVKTD